MNDVLKSNADEQSQAEDAALLIDWENLKYSLLNKGRDVSISALRDAVQRRGRLVVARAYADWREHDTDANNLYNSGIEPIFVPVRRHEGRIKNSVDVKLTADCIELIHRFPSIGTYMLVSGDQDFIHVINTLRPYGKRTVLIGVQGTTSVRLAEQVDEIMYYDTDVDPEAGATVVPVSGVRAGREDNVTIAANQILVALGYVNAPPTDLAEVVKLVTTIRAVLSDYRSSGRILLLSQLGIELTKRAHVEFLRHGKGRLKAFLTTMSAHSMIKVVLNDGVDWLFLPDEEPSFVSERIELQTGEEPAAPLVDWSSNPGVVKSRFMDLDDRDKTNIVDTIADLETRNDFVAFLLMRAALRLAGMPAGLDLDAILNDMIAEGMLKNGESRTWFDSNSSNSKEYPTFNLNVEHHEIARLLANKLAV